MSLKPSWERVHRAFDPLIPAGDVEHEEIVRIERPYSPLSALEEEMVFPQGFQRALIVGAPGSGKTTELLALLRQTSRLRPILVDLRQHFQDQRGDVTALDHLQPWEVLVVIGLAVFRYGKEQLGHRWNKGQVAALRAGIATPSGRTPAEVDVAGLAAEVAVLAVEEVAPPGGRVALRLLKAVGAEVSAKLPLGLPRAPDAVLTDQDQGVRQLLHAVSAMLLTLSEDYGKPTLLLVDGVDRGDATLARRLYEDSEILARLPCHQVMTADLSLRQRNLRGGWRSHFLGNIPVIDKESPMQPGPGCDFFTELWRGRAEAAVAETDLVPESILLQLGWASGGLIRMFCEMMQDLAKRAWAEDGRATPGMAELVVDTWRRRWEEDITASDIAVLEAVAAAHRLTGQHAREPELLDERCIVAWPNQSRWHFPHPLLLLQLVQLPEP